MAFFATPSGNAGVSRANFRDYMADKKQRDYERAMELLSQRDRSTTVGITAPTGAAPGMHQVSSVASAPIHTPAAAPAATPSMETRPVVPPKPGVSSAPLPPVKGAKVVSAAPAVAPTVQPHPDISGVADSMQGTDRNVRPPQPFADAFPRIRRVTPMTGGVAVPEQGLSSQGQQLLYRLRKAVPTIESSNDPTQVGKAGELGAWQVHPNTLKHGDPSLGIPPYTGDPKDYAALAQYGSNYLDALLQKYDGNILLAVTAYNWGHKNADSWLTGPAKGDAAKLPAGVRNHLRKLLLELGMDPAKVFGEGQKLGQADSVGVVAPTSARVPQTNTGNPIDVDPIETPPPGKSKPIGKDGGPVAQALRNSSPPEPKVIPTLLNQELQAGLAEQTNLINRMKAYRAAGMWDKYADARDAANTMSATVVHLANQKAVNLLEQANDGRMLAQIWSRDSGRRYQLQPRSDGNWNILIDGQIAADNVKTSDIVATQRASMSAAWTSAQNAAKAERASAWYDAKWKSDAAMALARFNKMAELQKQEWLNRANYKPGPDGSGVVMTTFNGKPAALSVTTMEGPDGEPITQVQILPVAGDTGSFDAAFDQ